MNQAPVPQSFLHWVISSVGGFYLILLLVSAALALILTTLVVVRGKGPHAGIALIFIVPLPLLIGIFVAILSGMQALSVIAMSDVQVKPSIIGEAYATALTGPLLGLVLMAPSYLLAMFGMLVRGMDGNAKQW